MLVRTSKRTFYCDAYKQSSSGLELLNLPFLCPALFGKANGPRKSLTTARAISSKSRLERAYLRNSRNPACSAPSTGRRLASTAAAIQYDPQHDDYVPWAESLVAKQNHQPSFEATGISALRPFDPTTSAVIIKDSLTTHPKNFRVKDSMTGDLNELHQNLKACLQVGRLERAAALLRRLNQIYNPDAAGLLAAHSEYVRELTHKIVQTNDQQLLKDLQRWFEVDLKHVGVNPDAEIYAQMIRATSQLPGASRERAMRRYQNMADEAGLGVETSALCEEDIEDFSPV